MSASPVKTPAGCPDSARLSVNVSVSVDHLLGYGDGDTGATSRHYGVKWAAGHMAPVGPAICLCVCSTVLYIKTPSCLVFTSKPLKEKLGVSEIFG